MAASVTRARSGHSPVLAFRPLEAADLDLVACWRGMTAASARARYADRLSGQAKKRAFVALVDGQPMALCQVYRLADFPGYETLLAFPPHAQGLDAFFAESTPAELAAAIVAACLTQVVSAAAPTCCYAAPAAGDDAAIAIYRRAGFRDVGRVTTPDGDEHVLVHGIDSLAG